MFKAHRDDIEVFRQDKPEAYKLLKHILESDAKVMKAQADATEVKLEVSYDYVRFHSKQKAQLLTLFWKHGQYQKTEQSIRLVPPSK